MDIRALHLLPVKESQFSYLFSKNLNFPTGWWTCCTCLEFHLSILQLQQHRPTKFSSRTSSPPHPTPIPSFHSPYPIFTLSPFHYPRFFSFCTPKLFLFPPHIHFSYSIMWSQSSHSWTRPGKNQSPCNSRSRAANVL